MANDHYVQRALMKFWSRYSAATDSWDNEVWFFDFRAKRLKKRSTRNLFAREGLNTPDVEARLGRLIESPLARFAHDDMRRRTSSPAVDTEKISDPDVMRAVALVFLIQGARGLDGLGVTSDSVSRWLAMSDGHLGWFANRFWENHRIATFTVPKNVTLFLPETGWYPFPIIDQKIGAAWCSALPLNPRVALVGIPREADLAYNDFNVAAIANFSVGVSAQGARVVVPTVSVDTHGQAPLASALPPMRADAERMAKTIEKMRQVIATAYQLVGLEPPVTMMSLRGRDGDGS